MSPLGALSEPLSLEQISAQIEQGRTFPPQGISRYGGEPVVASTLPELRDLWDRILPPMTPFDGAAGRAKPIILARFFAELSLSRATGYLSLRQNDAQLYFTIRIVDGQLLEIFAHDPSTYLGQLLVQQGVITPDDLTRTLKIALTQKLPIGKVCMDEGLISLKDLNKALAEQLFIRLRRIACFPRFDIRFRPDRRARMAAPVARVSGYAALEITLGYGLSDPEIKDYLSALRARPTLIDPKASGIGFLSGEDRNVLKRIHSVQDLSPLTDRPHWTQRDGALKAIAWDMLHLFKVPRVYALLEELSHLNDEGLNHLGLDEHSPEEDLFQVSREYIESLQLSAPSESPEEDRVKSALRAKVEALTSGPKLSPRERSAIDRMRQIGASLEDQELKRSLMFDEAMSDGESALKRSRFAEAHQSFHEAVTYKPQDKAAQLQLMWSSFLSSDRGEGAYRAVKAQAERLIKHDPTATEPLFKLAQVQRIFGDMVAAEESLRAVLKLDPEHAGAQGELRLLINREFDEKKRTRGLFKSSGAQVGLNSNVARGLIAALIGLSALIWGAGYLIPLDQAQWPELKVLTIDAQGDDLLEQKRSFYQSLRVNYDDELILSAAYHLGLKLHPKVKLNSAKDGYDFSAFQLGRTTEFSRAVDYLFERYNKDPEGVNTSLRESRIIPINMRVFGILESYWLRADQFWWLRRGLLLIVALLGLASVKPWEAEPAPRGRSQEAQRPWRFEAKPALIWSLSAALYGVVVGYLSPTLSSPTPTFELLGMIGLHTLAEQLTFTTLLCGALFKNTRGLPFSALLSATAVFTLYRLSYIHLWYLSLDQMALSVLQAGLFIGGVTFFLAWKTRSMLPPLIAHLSLTITPALLAHV